MSGAVDIVPFTAGFRLCHYEQITQERCRLTHNDLVLGLNDAAQAIRIFFSRELQFPVDELFGQSSKRRRIKVE